MRLIFFFIFFIPTLIKAQKNFKINRGYFNQPLPVDSTVIFSKGLISDEFGNRDMAISPNGDEIFYTLQYNYGMISAIIHSRKVNGKWSSPEVAEFSGKYKDIEPAFSADGARLYFSSDRPIKNENQSKDYNIWLIKKINKKWGKPENLGAPVNTEKDEYYASLAKNDNIYFTRAVAAREEDIMVCKFENGRYDTAVSLPDEINSVGDEFNAFVDPDEKYIIFSGYKRKDGYGNGDLYISKKNVKGKWEQAENLGAKINSDALDYCPYVTPDKKYFFFTSNRHNIKVPFSTPKKLGEIKSVLHSALNESDNIYWMKAENILY